MVASLAAPGSVLRGISQKADCVKFDQQFLSGVAGTAPSLAVKIDQGPKSFGFAADNGDHQGRPSVPARTNDSGVPPTPTQIGSGFWSGRG